MNLTFEAIAVSLTHRTHEAKHTEWGEKPKMSCVIINTITVQTEGFLLPHPSGSKLYHITPEFSRVYVLRMLQEMIAEYKEEKDVKIKWSLLADIFLLSSTWTLSGHLCTETEGTTKKACKHQSHPKISISDYSWISTNHSPSFLVFPVKLKLKLENWSHENRKLVFSAYGFIFMVGLMFLLKTIVDKNRTFRDEKGERHGV